MLWNFVLFVAAGVVLCGLCLIFCRSAGFVRSCWGKAPEVSLLLVVRNQAAAIEGIIREALAYYHKLLIFFELVVVDACSDDETQEILKRLNQRYPFKLIQMGEFPGAKPQEVGLRFCRGEVVYCIELMGEIDPCLCGRQIGCLLRGEEGLPSASSCSATLLQKKNVAET